MFYGNESISYYSRDNVIIWMLMALQAGLLNIGGFMACHRFVSHVTGFATFFGYEITKNNYSEAISMLVVPVFFLIGCMLSAVLVDLRLKLRKSPKYHISFGLIFFLTAIVYVAGVTKYFGNFGEPVEYIRDYSLLGLLCLICGLQNATITSVSKSVIRTTHLTGITTDLGIGIIRYFYRHKIKHDYANEGAANLMRLGIISFFILGSLVGAYAFKYWGFAGFVIPVMSSGLLFSILFYHHIMKRT